MNHTLKIFKALLHHILSVPYLETGDTFQVAFLTEGTLYSTETTTLNSIEGSILNRVYHLQGPTDGYTRFADDTFGVRQYTLRDKRIATWITIPTQETLKALDQRIEARLNLRWNGQKIEEHSDFTHNLELVRGSIDTLLDILPGLDEGCLATLATGTDADDLSDNAGYALEVIEGINYAE